jgi:hypothetical protein
MIQCAVALDHSLTLLANEGCWTHADVDDHMQQTDFIVLISFELDASGSIAVHHSTISHDEIARLTSDGTQFTEWPMGSGINKETTCGLIVIRQCSEAL